MRYKIWDKVSNVITPSGKVFTPEEWIEKYPVANSLDTICGGSEVNGNVFGVYSQFVEMYENQGCDFTGCVTKQDFLDRIEVFEDERNDEIAVNDNTRIADALEDLVVLNMPDVEEEQNMNFEILKERYEQGRITKSMLKIYVKKGVITQEEYDEIVGEQNG